MNLYIIYQVYILEHKDNVITAYRKLIKCPFIDLNSYQFHALERNVSNHDMSKFSVEEFEPYRMKFFPINDEEKESADILFDAAWKHHYRNNYHHWNYWREINESMGKINIIEMACDHIAMSMKFGGTALDWYKEQKEKNKINLLPGEESYYLALLNWYYNN